MQALGRLRERLGALPVTLVPILDATASLPGSGDAADGFDARQVDVVGVDLIAIQNLRYARDGRQRLASSFSSFGDGLHVGSSNQVVVTRPLADSLDVGAGDSLPVILGDQVHKVRIAAVVEAEENGIQQIQARLFIMDLPALQALVGQRGWIDRVELFLPDGLPADPTQVEVEKRIEPTDADSWRVVSASARKSAARQMTAAFRANLTILSGLALLVGVYLILQALEAAVVRRRPEIATLLSLGVPARTLQIAWVLESVTFGVVGTALGLALGYLGAQLAVQGVAQTVNALYLNTDASTAAWNWGEASIAALLGVGASVLAGILPARDAAGTPPVHILKQGSHSPGIRLLDHPWIGAGLIGLGLLLVRLPPVQWAGHVRFPLAGYAAALVWLVGASILVSALFPLLASALHAAGHSFTATRIALSQFRRPSGRHKLTVAGLVVAISMAAGMGILIHSFEKTMQVWIHSTLQADLFVACKGVQNASNRNRISRDTWQALQQDPDVISLEAGHIFPITLEDAQTFVAGIRGSSAWSEDRWIWVDRRSGPPGLDHPDPDGAWPAYISESFSHRFSHQVGDEVHLPTPDGIKRLRVAGIFADYGNERGSILADPTQVVRWFKDDRAVNAAVTLAPGVDADKVRHRWTKKYAGLAIRTNAALRSEVLRIFRQTFSITYALKGIGVVVAVAGLILALVSLLMERRRDLATLKELGMSSREICAAVTLEGGGIAAVGLVGGLGLSVALGYVLIFVINRQSFGWTLGFAVPWGSLLSLAALVLAASMISSAVVGRWAARLQGEQEE